jgi:hypothetical protein
MRALRLLISGAMVAAESASCSPRTLEQTTAFNGPRVLAEGRGYQINECLSVREVHGYHMSVMFRSCPDL